MTSRLTPTTRKSTAFTDALLTGFTRGQSVERHDFRDVGSDLKEIHLINIDDLTLGQLKQIAAMAGMPAAPAEKHPLVGRYVICRCYAAGVHAGTLVSQTGDQAVLANSRRLWSWTANSGVALSGLSQSGLKTGKVDTLLPTIALTGVIETIPCTAKAEETIHGFER